MLIRIDLVFSYWIFAWYLAYMANLTTYNPKLGLILGIIENILLTIVLIVFGATVSYISLFLLINVIIKVIPLYKIYNTKTTITDIYALIVLFIIYAVWLYINNSTVLEYQSKIFQSILHGTNETPAMWLVEKIRGYFHM